MASFADGESGSPGGRNAGNFKCPDCPEAFQTPADRYNHRRKDHPVEQHSDRATENPPTEPPVKALDVDSSQSLESDKPADLTEIMAGLCTSPYYELTRQFAYALQDTAPHMRANKTRGIIQAFNDNAHIIISDPAKLFTFCNMAGLANSQIRKIKMALFGMDDPQQYPYAVQGQGSPQAVIWNPNTGQWVPVIFVCPDNQGQLWQVAQPYYYP